MRVNDYLIHKAEQLKPELHSRTVRVEGEDRAMSRGDAVLFDFGEHLTGTVSFDLSYEGHHPDAPVRLIVRFAENEREFSEDAEAYGGWICKSWIQQEQVFADVIPGELKLPRRYAFRYVRLEVADISSRFCLKADGAVCIATTSADTEHAVRFSIQDEALQKIDEVSVRTLRECMQDVFEDGPKRDRRLWLGDLRLQMLTNDVTFRNYDLAKRCLYLFAGTSFDDGRMASCVFTSPVPEADDTYMFDYALLFTKALSDYYAQTHDGDALRDLWPCAKAQFEQAERYCGQDGVFRIPEEEGRCFIDWNLSLDKEVSALGVWLYCADAAKTLAEVLDDGEFRRAICRRAEERRVAGKRLFDVQTGLFVSGPKKQVSMASQIWAVLGGLTDDPEILERAKRRHALKMVSPYMHHYYLEALLKLGKKKDAIDVIRSYWGGMAEKGADTFWELYDPEDPDGSPYGGTVVNSYCHAWSCTPAWFIRTIQM
ncbi:MAG: hypothetical protein IJM50_00545 [Lachnospiraceae bacterium]|nr:hypothetical protein [Lachnospiraceae bacterium]